METTEIITILAQLAKSEGLHVESSDHDDPRWKSKTKESSNFLKNSSSVQDPGISDLKHKTGKAASSSGSRRVPNLRRANSEVLRSAPLAAAASGTVWAVVSGLAWNAASKAWKYVTGKYKVAVQVQVLPVNDLLMKMRDPDKERLADKMRKIMNEHSVVDLNAVADTIQQDSSFARQIILKHLVEYLIDDMSLPVRIPIENSSSQDSCNSFKIDIFP